MESCFYSEEVREQITQNKKSNSLKKLKSDPIDFHIEENLKLIEENEYPGKRVLAAYEKSIQQSMESQKVKCHPEDGT